MKIKALLVLLNINNTTDSRRLQPLGISYLHAMLTKNNIDCEMLDCNLIENFKDSDLLKIIQEGKYNFVGFSIYTSSFPRVLNVAKKIKKYDGEIFVSAGGVHSTICHKEIITENDCFDFAMRGDGEVQLLKLIQDLEKNGKPTYALDGVSYKNLNGNLVLTDVIYQEDNLDDLPFPTRTTFDKYSTRIDSVTGRTLFNVGVSTSRGCPYNCAFCSIPCMSLKWRGRSAENIANEVFEIFQKNENIFVIYVDDNFFVNKDRAIKIVSEVNKKCGKIIPFSFATRVNQIIAAGQNNLNFLKKNGCIAVELGIENGSNEILERFQKHTTIEENAKAMEMLRESGINVGVDYILFDKYISISEIKQNIKFLKETDLWGYYPALVYKRVIPYPGTKVREQYGTEKKYFVNDEVSVVFDYMEKFCNKFAARMENLLNKDLNGNFLALIKTLPYNYLEILVTEVYNKHRLHLKVKTFFKEATNLLNNVERSLNG